MARTMVLVAALLLLVLLIMSNRATPALHRGAMPAVEREAIGIDVHAEAAGVVMGHGAMPALESRAIGADVQAEAAGVVLGHGAMPTLECRAIEVRAETSDFISVATSLDGSAANNFHYIADSLQAFCNESLASFVASADDTSAQDTGTVKVFRNESLASFVASPDDKSAQDAGTLKVISAMFSMALLWISLGIKWKTPRKVNIVLTALLLASITHCVESVEPAEQPPPPTVLVQFDIEIFEPTFIQQRDELVVKTNCPFVDGHYIMPMEEYEQGGPVKPPPRWVRVDSVGKSGKLSSVIMRGDTNYLLAFVDGPGLVHFMGLENSPLFPGAHRLPFNESYPSLFDVENEPNADIVEYLITIPLGKNYTEVANCILSDYTSATPDKVVREAILTYTITLGESQRIKSLGDRLRKNWDGTTFLTRDEAWNMLVWSRLCTKWCDQKLGTLKNAFNRQLIDRGLFSIDAINSTIDLVKPPRADKGRCATINPQK